MAAAAVVLAAAVSTLLGHGSLVDAWRGGQQPAAAAAAAAGNGSPWNAGYFPNAVLTDQHGRQWRFYDDLLKGKAVAVNTFFTVCSDVCPLSTAKMLELQRLLGARMGRDIHFYSLSIDPLRDSPQAMAAYAKRYGIGPGWLLLTGKEEDIRQISRKLGLGVLQQTEPREAHSTTLTVGHEPSGQWMKAASTDNPSFLAAHMATFLGWPADAATAGQADARLLNIGTGELLFRNACASCHEIGAGRKIGPDLLHVDQRRSRDWLARFVQSPDQMLNAGDPVAQQLLREYQGVRMPNLDLTPGEVSMVLDYIGARSARLQPRPNSASAR